MQIRRPLSSSICLAEHGMREVPRPCGCEKERATVMLMGDSNGKKYTPFVVFKVGKSKKLDVQVENETLRHGFGRRLWRDVQKMQDETGLHIYGNQKGKLDI